MTYLNVKAGVLTYLNVKAGVLRLGQATNRAVADVVAAADVDQRLTRFTPRNRLAALMWHKDSACSLT
jgi:hypothetical protein